MQLARLLERTLRAGLIRLADDFDLAEDALQEACARALEAWPRRGLPDNAGPWLNTVARRIVLDRIRRDRLVPLSEDFDPPDDAGDINRDVVEVSIPDDRLRLLFTCRHPAIAPEHAG